MNNESIFENNQLIVSRELLHFIRWIVTTQPETLNALMHQAYQSEFMSQTAIDASHSLSSSHEELQQNVIDFFDLLELKLQETYFDMENDNNSAEKVFRPAVNQIDSSLCDNDVVALSVTQATSQLQINSQNAREALYQELLKNWRPRTKHLH